MTRRTYVKITPCVNSANVVLQVTLSFVRNGRAIAQKVVEAPTAAQLESLRDDGEQWAVIGKVEFVDMTGAAAKRVNPLKFN